ncbi:hypothetical protein LXL04_030565 [Taraxacum kok-saghyz]
MLASSVYRRWPPSQSSIAILHRRLHLLLSGEEITGFQIMFTFLCTIFLSTLNCQVDIYIDLEAIDEEEEESDFENWMHLGCVWRFQLAEKLAYKLAFEKLLGVAFQ